MAAGALAAGGDPGLDPYPEATAREQHAVTEEDWDLAGQVMARSRVTRSLLEEHAAEARSKANKARGMADAERQAVMENELDLVNIRKAAAAITRQLDGAGWASHSDLRRKCFRHREFFDDAIGHLLATGQIERETTTYKGQQGARYRLAV